MFLIENKYMIIMQKQFLNAYKKVKATREMLTQGLFSNQQLFPSRKF